MPRFFFSQRFPDDFSEKLRKTSGRIPEVFSVKIPAPTFEGNFERTIEENQEEFPVGGTTERYSGGVSERTRVRSSGRILSSEIFWELPEEFPEHLIQDFRRNFRTHPELRKNSSRNI